ncbi:MAG: phosphoglycerate kinase [Candidatus Spechtbacterales bacterium]|nr:phosphoglycerate kinase [Candidatus Spechtbacterales bacterium]
MRTIENLKIKKGTRVLLRADFNVVIEDGEVADDFRIEATLPTLKYLEEKEAKILIVSHLGRPEGRDASFTLKPVAKRLGELIKKEVVFFETYSEALEEADKLEPGSVALLENIRFDPREREGSVDFAKELAALGEVMVNDAFGDAHREHTSVYHLPKIMESGAGLLMQKEVEVLDDIRNPRKRPLVFVMGGAKVETKLKTLVEMIDIIDEACLGGLMANTLLEKKGYTIGKSRKAEGMDDYLNDFDIASKKLHLPLDVVVSTEASDSGEVRVTGIGNVNDHEMILDAGPETVQLFSNILEKAGTVVWNGPLGLMEVDQFRKGTYALAKKLNDISAKVIVGGGDIMAAIDEVGAEGAVDYASTGGGAMLEYLAAGTLPAIEALS